MANTYVRLACMNNPWRTFGLGKKPLSMIIFHRDENVGDHEFRRWILDSVMQESPFFRNLPHKHNIRILTSGPRGKIFAFCLRNFVVIKWINSVEGENLIPSQRHFYL